LEKKRLRDKEKVYIRQIERAKAEADAASLAKSRFLSIMSHEIRTPMNAILGYAQLMSRDPGLGGDAKTNLKIIGRSGDHLLSLINDVLDISRIEAGHTDLKPAIFSLPNMLDDLAAMFRLRAESGDLLFEMLLDGEVVPYVVADEGRIRQALINLLGNAMKFTSRGRICLHVTLKQRIGGRLWLSARVEDTGCGISEEDQRTLFEPFSQAKGVLASRQEGTGLGLAITRKCARLMGGDVTVSSSYGKGSIFRFEIPIERADPGVAVRRMVPPRVIGLRAGTEAPRILVVDDQIENRDLLMKLLTLIGFSTRTAADGEAGIRNWEEWDPQLILMNARMPVMDGLEATRRIKADPRGKETVIVTLTAGALVDDRRAAFQSGADDFLTKPYHEDELLSKIGALLNITYDYQKMSEGDEGRPPAGVESLRAEGLGQLPMPLVEELRAATFSGNIRRLGELILQVRATAGAESAHALQELVDNYEYDALARLLEEASHR
jgi:CheY-like chemotaxis protein/nitrogen-specific signal transduction histidine kinase